MLTRTIERVCALVLFCLLFGMLMWTNGSVKAMSRSENGKYSHLDHRITALRQRLEKTEGEITTIKTPPEEPKPKAEPEEVTPEPVSYADLGGYAAV